MYFILKKFFKLNKAKSNQKKNQLKKTINKNQF